jgi:ParB family chromosome partitioning protein
MKALSQEIPVSKIIANPDQPRRLFDEDELFSLAQSIKAEGVLQPLRVRPCDDRFMIVMGERRWRAARQAGLATVPCIIEDAALPAERTDIRAVVENELRSDLAPMELANALKRIMAANGWTGAEAAANLNLTPARVSRALALLRLPEAVQAKVASGEISPAKA